MIYKFTWGGFILIAPGSEWATEIIWPLYSEFSFLPIVRVGKKLFPLICKSEFQSFVDRSKPSVQFSDNDVIWVVFVGWGCLSCVVSEILFCPNFCSLLSIFCWSATVSELCLSILDFWKLLANCWDPFKIDCSELSACRQNPSFEHRVLP